VVTPADGYTVLLIKNPANYINASLYGNLKFNSSADIGPIAASIGAQL